MLNRLKLLRTNENVLLAIDALLHSKSAFLSTFLMTYMIRVSLTDSPSEYIVFRMLSYAMMAFLSIVLFYFIKKHLLLSWRLGMLFSILQVVIIVTLSGEAEIFPYILAVITGIESTLYWRPNMFFVINEVSNERRLRFQSIRQIATEVAKIAMPLALGLLITDSGYISAAYVILAISVVQFLLSILFRPASAAHISMHKTRTVFRKIVGHRGLRRVLYLQFFRGALVSGSAFLIIPKLLVYDFTNSDLTLGFYTSVAAIITIFIVVVFRKIAHSRRHIRAFLAVIGVLGLVVTTALVVLPNSVTAIILFIFAAACIEGFFNMYVNSRIQHKLKKYLPDNSYVIEIESASEVYLCAGRVLSLGVLLLVINTAGNVALPLFAAINILLIFPTIFLTQPKPEEEKGRIPKLQSNSEGE